MNLTMADLCVINVYDYGYSQTCLKTFIHHEHEQALTGDTSALLNISKGTTDLGVKCLGHSQRIFTNQRGKVVTNQTDIMYNVLRNGYVRSSVNLGGE